MYDYDWPEAEALVFSRAVKAKNSEPIDAYTDYSHAKRREMMARFYTALGFPAEAARVE